MYDGIFIISNALVVRGAVSIYSIDERLQKTLETIASIDKYVQNNLKIMFDASPERPSVKLFQEKIKKKCKDLLFR